MTHSTRVKLQTLWGQPTTTPATNRQSNLELKSRMVNRQRPAGQMTIFYVNSNWCIRVGVNRNTVLSYMRMTHLPLVHGRRNVVDRLRPVRTRFATVQQVVRCMATGPRSVLVAVSTVRMRRAADVHAADVLHVCYPPRWIVRHFVLLQFTSRSQPVRRIHGQHEEIRFRSASLHENITLS